MNSRYLQQIETYLSYIPLVLLALWSVEVLIGMLTINPYGTYVISFVPSIYTGVWKLGRHIRGFTLLSVAVSYATVFYMTSYLRPILRTMCSGLVSFVGLIHYEFWWHLGLQWDGQAFYWGVFTICLFMFLYFVNMYINMLDLSRNRILMLGCFYAIFILSWVAVINSGFYQQFNLHAAGMVPDPTNFWWAVNKTIGIVMWGVTIRDGGRQ